LSLKNNDPAAMTELFKSYWEFTFDAAFKKVGDEEVAQDITQEIFISIWENRATLNIEGSLSAYLYGAVKYRVINYFRVQAMLGRHHAELTILMDAQRVQETDTKLILKDMNSEIEAAFARLPDRMRLVTTMSRRQDKSIKDIAEELGISAQTVKNQITAAMKILKENLTYILLLVLFRA
jgi:RNA polymerase sigma-70 factor (family 1)